MISLLCAAVMNEEQEQFLRELVGPVSKFFEVISYLFKLADELICRLFYSPSMFLLPVSRR